MKHSWILLTLVATVMAFGSQVDASWQSCSQSCGEFMGPRTMRGRSLHRPLEPHAYATFYRHILYGGDAVHIGLNGRCKNLLEKHCFYGTDRCIEINDIFSSVDTHGYCLIAYAHKDCQGSSIEFKPGSGCHDNFLNCRIRFNDVITSVGPCEGEEA